MKRDDRRGFTLIVVCLCVVSLLGMLGLSLDLGRVYVAKNEVQSFTDSAALAASLALNGESFAAAQEAVRSDTSNRWNMGTATFTDPNGSTVLTTEFAKPLAANAARPDPSTWSSAPNSAAGYTFVRVTATATLPLYILPVVGAGKAQLVAASSVAGQVPLRAFESGLLPFSPIAHTGGMIVGNWYTLRYPAGGGPACSGDQSDSAVLALANKQPAEESGFYQEPQESVVRDEVVDGMMRFPLTVQGTIKMSGGTVNIAQRALNERIELDTDRTSTTYEQYQANIVNGKRIGNGGEKIDESSI